MKIKAKPNRALVFAGMGFELFAIALGAMYLGPVLDQYFPLKGLGAPLVLFVLFFAWVVHFIHLLKKVVADNQAQAKSHDESNP